MKTYIFLLSAFFSISVSLAQQTEAQKKLLETMSDEACIELDKVDLSTISKDEVTTQLGVCLLPSVEKHKKEIEALFNLDPSTPTDMRALGEKMGGVMVLRCPKMVDITKMMMGDKAFRDEIKERTAAKKKTIEVSGKVKKVEEKDFYYVYFSTDTDDIIKLTVLFKVANENELTELLNDKSKKDLVVSYYVDEVYSVKDNAFKSLKIIYSVRAKNN